LGYDDVAVFNRLPPCDVWQVHQPERPSVPSAKTNTTRGAAASRKAAPERRTKGRPLGADPAARKQQIVDAAREVLRVTPPAKVTRDQVAQHASVDPKLVSYYFGDLPTLFTAVIRDIVADNLHRFREIIGAGSSAHEVIKRRIRLLLDIHAENPYYIDLMTEFVTNSDALQAAELREAMFFPFYEAMENVLVNGVAHGELRATDRKMTHIAIIGVCQHFIAARPLFDAFIERQESRTAQLDRYAEFAADLILYGLVPRSDAR
jgi:AcrR family transcriptional regulator